MNKTINYFFGLFIFLNDLFFFKWIKKNSPISHSYMLRFFYLTGGVSNDIINFFVSKKPLVNSCKEVLLSKYDAKILLLGMAYKRNVDDLRESGSIHLMNMLLKENIGKIEWHAASLINGGTKSIIGLAIKNKS